MQYLISFCYCYFTNIFFKNGRLSLSFVDVVKGLQDKLKRGYEDESSKFINFMKQVCFAYTYCLHNNSI